MKISYSGFPKLLKNNFSEILTKKIYQNFDFLSIFEFFSHILIIFSNFDFLPIKKKNFLKLNKNCKILKKKNVKF